MVEQNNTFDPVDVGLFGADTIVPENPLTHMELDNKIRQNWPLSGLEPLASDMAIPLIPPATRYGRALRAKMVIQQKRVRQ
jgi:hypothetical protein